MSNDLHQQLVFKTLQCNRKIDNCHLHTNLRGIVRIGQLRGNVESEIRAVVHVGFAKSNKQAARLLEDSLGQNRLECRIETFAYVFKQHWISNADAVFKCSQVCRLCQLDDLYTICLLHLPDPSHSLCLRINHQRPAAALGHDNTIFDGERICRKALDVPIADGGRIANNPLERKVRIHRDLPAFTRLYPRIKHTFPESQSEGTSVCNGPCRQQNVTSEVNFILTELLERRFPPHLFTGQTTSELLSPTQSCC
mmetsp:Transcript_65031/g.105404  ORF Transcript_65031/g.105404 Transcript_65031/m.105404 type:complete len:253 (-) Transcript_65031:678-1436(-)